MSKNSQRIRKLVISALCLSIAIVLGRLTAVYLPLFGQNGMKISFSGIFSVLPSFMFGPVYGAVVSGLSDFLGWVLNPAGAYLPLLTLVIAGGAFIRGCLWKVLRDRKGSRLRIVILVITLALLITGAYSFFALNADGITNDFYEMNGTEDIETSSMHAVSRMVITRTITTSNPSGNLASYIVTMTWGILGSGILAGLTLVVDFLISKLSKEERKNSKFLAVFVSALVSGLIITTLNTIVLREQLFESWKYLPFVVIWLPRAVQEIASECVKSYFVAALLSVAEKNKLFSNKK